MSIFRNVCLKIATSYLDLLLSIESDGQLRTSLYDKRDDFNFHITNFPSLSSNIPSSQAYGVFISQLIRYAGACSSNECFILRATRLSSKLLGQGYVTERLKSSLRKFYGRYGDLIKHYEVSLSQMLHDILGRDHIQWHPQYAISQLRIVRSGLHLVTYLNVGNFCDKRTENDYTWNLCARFQQTKPICIVNLRIGLACWNR